MFAHFGRVPRLVVPDNLKSGIHRPSFYDPEANPTYARMADHYGVGILPARPYRPRDKAKVEAGVRVAQSYILGRLRNVTFFSLAECNQAIAGALEQINGRIMRKLGVSRRDLFLQVELPAMRPLPAAPYEYAEWKRARVNQDYHVEIQGFYYSVPHTLIREEVEARLTVNAVGLRIQRLEPPVEEAPIDKSGQPHQFVPHVDHLLKARPEQANGPSNPGKPPGSAFFTDDHGRVRPPSLRSLRPVAGGRRNSEWRRLRARHAARSSTAPQRPYRSDRPWSSRSASPART
jgi:hypothetical protein